jgi:hypothetical protein
MSAIRTFLLFILVPVIVVGQNLGLEEDNSDHWSILNPAFPYLGRESSKAELAPGNFQIASVLLRTAEFDNIAAKLGKARIADRSAGSYARHHACYTPEKGPPKVHLIFEFGEDMSNFYLFSDMLDWKGSELCVKSAKVSASLATPSGLKLGLSPTEVEKILGKPDRRTADRFIYDRLVQRKTTAAKFDEVGLYIEVRFSESKLTYLVVSMTGTATG